MYINAYVCPRKDEPCSLICSLQSVFYAAKLLQLHVGVTSAVVIVVILVVVTFFLVTLLKLLDIN